MNVKDCQKKSTENSKIIVNRVQKYINRKDWDLAEKTIKEYQLSYNRNQELSETYAMIPYLKGDLNTSINRYYDFFQKFGTAINSIKIFRRVENILISLNRSHELPDFFKLTYTNDIIQADKSYNCLLNNNISKAIDEFYVLLKKLFIDQQLQNIWMQSFLYICYMYDNSIKIKHKDMLSVNSNIYYNDKKYKKIFFAGMVSSGASAPYDFFKEFKSSAAIQPEESRHLTGNYGLVSLTKGVESYDNFRNKVLNYFANSLLGVAAYKDALQLKTIKKSKEFANSSSSYQYALGVLSFCAIITKAYKNNKLDAEKYNKAKNVLINTLCSMFTHNSCTHTLFDNVIPIAYMHEVEHINNSCLICVVRDPRSNYVRRIEMGTIKPDDRIDTFISFYKKKYNKAVSLHKKLNKKQEKKIFFVQFEKFVYDQQYRKNLAIELGFDLADQVLHKYFRPWESQKNIFVHENYPNQEQIKYIHDSLKEYCLDLEEFQINR